MKFRQTVNSEIPSADLIPMLNVMMGILAFFVIVALSLSAQQSLTLQLPEEIDSTEEAGEAETLEEPLTKGGPMVVQLFKDGKLKLEETDLDKQRLQAQIKSFLATNDKDPIFLVPNRKQKYEKVLQTLGIMKEVGGDRVSLVIDDIGQ